VTDEELRVVLDERVAKIEDHIAGKFYGPAGPRGRPFEEAVRRARDLNLGLGGAGAGARTVLLLLSGNAALCVALLFAGRKARGAPALALAGERRGLPQPPSRGRR
jgi:hypothetical protein